MQLFLNSLTDGMFLKQSNYHGGSLKCNNQHNGTIGRRQQKTAKIVLKSVSAFGPVVLDVASSIRKI